MKYAFIFAILVFFAGCDKPTSEAVLDEKTEYNKVEQWLLSGKHTKIQIKTLHHDRDQNTLASEEKFKDKAVITTGIALKIDKEITGLPYILMKDPNSDDQLQAVFPEYATSGLMQIKKGDSVSIAGEYGGRLIGLFQLKNCILIES